jgi:hypothetical protein
VAKSKTGRFRSVHDTGVSLHVDGRGVIRLDPDQSYETDNPAELEALRGSADVREMESTEDKGGSKRS